MLNLEISLFFNLPGDLEQFSINQENSYTSSQEETVHTEESHHRQNHVGCQHKTSDKEENIEESINQETNNRIQPVYPRIGSRKLLLLHGDKRQFIRSKRVFSPSTNQAEDVGDAQIVNNSVLTKSEKEDHCEHLSDILHCLMLEGLSLFLSMSVLFTKYHSMISRTLTLMRLDELQLWY